MTNQTAPAIITRSNRQGTAIFLKRDHYTGTYHLVDVVTSHDYDMACAEFDYRRDTTEFLNDRWDEVNIKLDDRSRSALVRNNL